MKKRLLKLLVFGGLCLALALSAEYRVSEDLRWVAPIFSWFTGAAFGYYMFRWRLQQKSYFGTYQKRQMERALGKVAKHSK